MNESFAQHEICSIILDFAKSENDFLRENFQKGIFHMPELGFAYEAGKRIAVWMNQHYGSSEYIWVREKTLSKEGPTDLVFETTRLGQPNYAIEFKLDNTYHSYTSDIRKLNRLSIPGWQKYFCSLKWVMNGNQADGFLETLKREFDTVADLVCSDHFSTVVGTSTQEQLCLFTFWKVQ